MKRNINYMKKCHLWSPFYFEFLHTIYVFIANLKYILQRAMFDIMTFSSLDLSHGELTEK